MHKKRNDRLHGIGNSFYSNLKCDTVKTIYSKEITKKSATLAKSNKIFQRAQRFESFSYENVKIGLTKQAYSMCERWSFSFLVTVL